ncbi:MAG: helicase SNF2, partial [Parcubacteria group bacterium CG_4_9_14_0_2_um_filter_41_8]
MSIIQFGKTWWGEKWLEAFLDISYENRIPRGKSYARKGAVLNVNIKNNRIAAFVQGSRKNPYSVEIIIPEFRAAEKKSILEIIKNNGLYLSSLLARQMPEDLHQSFIDKKIYLFPRKWDDLKANCSCPDWAVPCKHIAAVICMVANEIDKNPFLVFSLHNFDMAAELKSAGFDVEKSEKESIKSVQDIFKK